MQAEYVLDYDVVSLERERHLYLLVRIKAGALAAQTDRRPLNLSVVLDRSGSMIGDKLAYVKQAAQFLVQHLGAEDTLSMVSYNEEVKVDLPPTPVTHKDLITQAIDSITAYGSTNLSGGWLQGCTLVAQKLIEGQVNRVLLLSDGLANRGVTDAAKLATMARQKREEGVSTTTMGVGMDFNEDLMLQMATEGGGAFYFIDNPDQAPAIFAEELSGLLNVVGQNLTVALSLYSDVQMVRQLNNYTEQAADHQIAFKLGDLYADEIKTLVLELAIPALESLGEVEVGRLRFEYDELGPDNVTHRSLELPIMVNVVTEDVYAQGQSPDRDVLKSALLLRAARAREEAIKHADKGEFEAASRVLSGIADEIEQSRIDDPVLRTHHNMLREEAVDMELGARRYDSYSRKSSAAKSHYAMRDSDVYQTVALHERHKASRYAMERSGDAPSLLIWQQEQMDLTSVQTVTIGRSDENDIVIPEEGVSLNHCRIVREGDALLLEDLNSTNGTFANGGRVKGRFQLSQGDIMTVGSWMFMFRE